MPSAKNKKLDPFFDFDSAWRDPLRLLRQIMLDLDLVEEIKWKHPCYTHAGQNVCIFGNFRDGANVSFFLGALLDDPQQLLEKVGENTRAGRLIRFESVADIHNKRSALEALLNQAINHAAKGTKFDFEGTRDERPEPDELVEAHMSDVIYRQAWEALTPGRRRAWLIHFTSAKQSQTKTNRIAKARDKVLAGKGWNER